MRTGTRIRGFKVHQDGRGKITLERIPYYSRKNASAKIKARKSTRSKPVTQGVLGLFYKREG